MSKRKGGFTLIELVVTIAIMGILSVFVISSYTDTMREKRHEADTATLNEVNTQLNVLLTYEECWNEVLKEVDTANKEDSLVIVFHCKGAGKHGIFNLADTTMEDEAVKLSAQMPRLYNGLIETFGNTLEMESSDHLNGKYKVTCKFNSSQLSTVRDFTITHDNTIITGEQIWEGVGG